MPLCVLIFVFSNIMGKGWGGRGGGGGGLQAYYLLFKIDTLEI